MRNVTPVPQITGPEVRNFRRDSNWNQEQLARLLAVSKAYVQKIESAPDQAPAVIAERIFGVKQARLFSGEQRNVAPQPSRKFHDFRRSTNFARKPSFTTLPNCECGDSRCHLTPVADGGLAGGVHWWKFKGLRCRRLTYLNEKGRKEPPIARYKGDAVPQGSCSKCGRQRALGKKYSARLERDVYIRYCHSERGDSKELKHDQPTHYFERSGKFVELSANELEKLHGRSRHEFAVPKCGLSACPRQGKTMERSAVLQLKDADGGISRIATYRCRPLNPAQAHATYRVLPIGTEAERIGFGRYRWTDPATGRQHETFNRKRPIRKNRAMPSIECPEHHCKVNQVSGPWPVSVKGLRDKRGSGERPAGRIQRWRARCPAGNHFVYVRSDGVMQSFKGSRWRKPRGGARPGPRPETTRRITWAAAFDRCGHSQRKMAEFVAPDKHNTALAYIRSFFSEWRAEILEARTRLSEAEAQSIVSLVQGMTVAKRIEHLQSVGNSSA